MPTYSYGCSDCGHEFDATHKIDDRKIPVESDCPECGKKSVKQFISGANVCSSVRLGITKAPSEVRERLNHIKKTNPKNKMPDY